MSQDKKIYNKLVRDKIPDIIKDSGKTCEIIIAHENEKYILLGDEFY